MKTVILSVLAVAALALTSCGDGKKSVSPEELPSNLQSMIAQNFGDEQIAYATVEREGFGKKYEVLLSSGTGIEADGKGNWQQIKSRTGVPAAVLPQRIAGYVEAKHPGAAVVKIENGRNGYEIELSNGLEIKFDKDFVVREYDS